MLSIATSSNKRQHLLKRDISVHPTLTLASTFQQQETIAKAKLGKHPRPATSPTTQGFPPISLMPIAGVFMMVQWQPNPPKPTSEPQADGQARLLDSELTAMAAAAGMPLPTRPDPKQRKHAGMRVLVHDRDKVFSAEEVKGATRPTRWQKVVADSPSGRTTEKRQEKLRKRLFLLY